MKTSTIVTEEKVVNWEDGTRSLGFGITFNWTDGPWEVWQKITEDGPTANQLTAALLAIQRKIDDLDTEVA